MIRFCLLSTLLLTLSATPTVAQPSLREEALAAIERAATFYREKVATHGGYVYYASVDLKDRWGEGKANADTLFVQPPGTPTVGIAYLRAYEATGDRAYLDAAKETALALVYGQLESGGWTQTIHFGPANRLGKYRNGKGGSSNTSSLDDDQTQAALRCLMQVDAALDFKQADIHEAAVYGLNALLKAQFANGGFPQVWSKDVEPKGTAKASYPDYDWKTEGRVKNYWDYYTLNDGLPGSVCEVLLMAQRIYKDDRYRTALTRLGDFLLLARMPEPQPGWCQQYNDQMLPMWARKFEPPAVSGWESQDAMETLIRIARATGEKKYLEPIPRSIEYFRKSLLPDGKVARFYELKTNKPLYMDAAYKLTYDDAAAPKHYGWTQSARFDAIEKTYREARDGSEPATTRKVTDAEVRKILDALDAEGRWTTTHAGERLVGQPPFASGFKYISSAVFSQNVETLARYLGQQ